MRYTRLAAIGLTLFLLAGCSSGSDDSTTDPSDSWTTGAPGPGGSGSTTSPGSSSSSPSSGGSSENRAPVPKVELSVAVGAAPLSTNITASATDPDGDKLTGQLSFGDGTPPLSGSTFPMSVSHTFSAAGNYTVTLTVTDSKKSVNATAAVTVTAVGATLHVDDPAGDAQADFADLLTVDPSKTAESLVVVLGVKTVWPVGLGYSPFGYGLNVNGGAFRCYAYQDGVLLWDATAVAYVADADGTCTWDTTANTVTFSITLAYLADTDTFTAPFQLITSSFEGGLAQNVNDFTDDLAPDTGSIVLP